MDETSRDKSNYQYKSQFENLNFILRPLAVIQASNGGTTPSESEESEDEPSSYAASKAPPGMSINITHTLNESTTQRCFLNVADESEESDQNEEDGGKGFYLSGEMSWGLCNTLLNGNGSKQCITYSRLNCAVVLVARVCLPRS